MARIDRLRRTGTGGRHPGDEVELRRLPAPVDLRAADPDAMIPTEWNLWITSALRAESLVANNRTGSMRRVLRSLRRGHWWRRR